MSPVVKETAIIATMSSVSLMMYIFDFIVVPQAGGRPQISIGGEPEPSAATHRTPFI
jgi:hypothetical protein